MYSSTCLPASGMLFVVLVTLSGLGFDTSPSPKQSMLLSEDFEDAFPPDGWLTASEGGAPWRRTSPGHESKHAAGTTATTDEEDSWMITPGLKLVQGVEYTVSYWRKSTTFGSDDASYRLRLGSHQKPGKMTIPIASSSFVSGHWARRAHTFTPTATAMYYLGFHCNSSDWQSNGLFIDDLRVSR